MALRRKTRLYLINEIGKIDFNNMDEVYVELGKVKHLRSIENGISSAEESIIRRVILTFAAYPDPNFIIDRLIGFLYDAKSQYMRISLDDFGSMIRFQQFIEVFGYLGIRTAIECNVSESFNKMDNSLALYKEEECVSA